MGSKEEDAFHYLHWLSRKFCCNEDIGQPIEFVSILYWKSLKHLKFSKSAIEPYEDISREIVDTRGYINLYTKFREGNTNYCTIKVQYIIINANTYNNILIDKPFLNAFDVLFPPLTLLWSPFNNKGHNNIARGLEIRECYVDNLTITYLPNPQDPQ